MSEHYHCDACEEQMTHADRWYLYYIYPLGENVSKYDLCKGCMKKVTKFMKSLKEGK